MAALSSTRSLLPTLNNRTSLYTITSPFNLNTHLTFPPSNSKRLNFSIKAGKKDYLSNDLSKEGEVKNEPNQKKYKDRKKIKIGSKFYDNEAAQRRRKMMDKKIEELRFKVKDEADVLERLETLQEAYKPLDLIKLSDCFDDDTFSVTKIEQYESGGMFYGNLRVPVDQALPLLEKKLSEAAGKEVDLFIRKVDKELELVTMLPKSQTDLMYELKKQSTSSGYAIAAALSVATLGTTALMSGLFLKSDAMLDYYLADVLPLFGGFLSILGVSEIATRVTAARYGVKLSPSFLIPSIWTGCFGVMNSYESNIPNRKASFDIPVARTASAYLISLLLIAAAFITDGSLNGGDNPLYLRPDFFFNNPLVSIIQLVSKDDFSNMLPYEVEGLGVALDPLALAGLLGMIVTSLNLLPCGGLEGRRIIAAIFGQYESKIISYATHFLLLGIGAISGSVLFVAWVVFTIVYQSASGLVAKDSITPLGEGRYALGLFMALICFLTLFPNAAGTFSSWSLTEPYFRGFV